MTSSDGEIAGPDVPALPALAELLLQCSRDCVKVIDGDGRVETFNDNGLRAMEIDRLSQVVGLPWSSLWPEESRPTVEGALAEARERGVSRFTAACSTAKGTPKWWDVNVSAVFENAPRPRFVVVSRDITEERKAAEAERQAGERLMAVVAASGNVLWDIDLASDKVWWSEGFQAVFGYTPSEQGDSLRWCHERMHPEDRDRVISGMSEALQGSETFWEDRFRYRDARGQYRHVHDRGSIFRDRSGKALRFAGVMQDITEHKTTSDLQLALAREMAHRMNNLLVVVSGLFEQTAARSGDVEELRESFGLRLQAMATANSVLVRDTSGGADLKSLVTAQLGAYIKDERLCIEGERIALKPEIGQPLALVINELSTNALKYGALSSLEGRVQLKWSVDPACRSVVIGWQERHGPEVRPPRRVGMGSRLLDRAIPGARVEKRFDPRGFECSIRLPPTTLLDRVAEAR